ncbi:MAG TPA: hypothetical protein VJA40_02625 [archaeon]|nr:hypothetical protein [archaeon]
MGKLTTMAQRGQDMPMEVMVGVIIMVFVLVGAGTFVSIMTKQQCVKQLDGAFSDFSTTFDQVINSGIGREKIVSFHIPECYDPERSTFIIRNEAGEDCKVNCFKTVTNCTILSFAGCNFLGEGTGTSLGLGNCPRDRIEFTTPFCMTAYIDDGTLQNTPTCGGGPGVFQEQPFIDDPTINYFTTSQPLKRENNLLVKKLADGSICINQN